MTTTNRLAFGANELLVDGVRAAWGARLIVTQHGGVDFLADRQDLFGSDEDQAAIKAFLREVFPTFIGTVKRGLTEGWIKTRESCPNVYLQDRIGAIVGDTHGSAGYLYVAGFRFEHLPEGHPTKGLEYALGLATKEKA